jgi:hypothetical protein
MPIGYALLMRDTNRPHKHCPILSLEELILLPVLPWPRQTFRSAWRWVGWREGQTRSVVSKLAWHM